MEKSYVMLCWYCMLPWKTIPSFWYNQYFTRNTGSQIGSWNILENLLLVFACVLIMYCKRKRYKSHLGHLAQMTDLNLDNNASNFKKKSYVELKMCFQQILLVPTWCNHSEFLKTSWKMVIYCNEPSWWWENASLIFVVNLAHILAVPS